MSYRPPACPSEGKGTMEECKRHASGMYGSAEFTRSGGGCPRPQQLYGSSCESGTDEEGDEESGDRRTMECKVKRVRRSLRTFYLPQAKGGNVPRPHARGPGGVQVARMCWYPKYPLASAGAW
ncbi:hypothetical protein C8F04DRAFT_1184028 [Mycena alexandri]|uniref:Uncharacterized protein n=1 Tax=Mycena alexandri TaxID=1745969 RepID=A0AAD6SWC4_9AGAR|nr:hypothetical protein C8F04DRAFT_1184028 [Mycena alexandri]